MMSMIGVEPGPYDQPDNDDYDAGYADGVTKEREAIIARIEATLASGLYGPDVYGVCDAESALRDTVEAIRRGEHLERADA